MKQPEDARIALVRQWAQKAEEDLAAVAALLSHEHPLLSPVCFHAQQAAEKYLKAFLTFNEIAFPKTHSIAALLDLVSQTAPQLAADLEDAIELTPYGVEVRYPGDIPELSLAEAKEAVALAKKVRDAVMAKLPGGKK
jgi:HEPN domain-containing protein